MDRTKQIPLVALLFIMIFGVVSCSDMLGRYTASDVDHGVKIETRGKEFFVSFPINAINSNGIELYLSITGDTAATGQITIAGIEYDHDFTITPHTVTQVNIPIEAMVSSNETIENLGIHITSEQPVAVSGINHQPYTTDSFLAYPVSTCGTEYFVMSYESSELSYSGSDFTLIGIHDNTEIEITPAVSATTHQAGTTYAVTLNMGQTYRLCVQGGGKDLTGSHIVSNKPVAVFSGNAICYIPPDSAADDHITEQLLPISLWDTTYMAVPFMDRNGDTIRILAGYDNTSISLNDTVIATLNAGEYIERIITENSIIKSGKPVCAAQFANSAHFDVSPGSFGDPFMLIIPSSKQFRTAYTFSPMHADFTNNYINIIVPASAISEIRLDGSLLESNIFSSIDEYYYGAQISIIQATHTITGPSKFGLIMYGFATYDSYGHSGG